MRKFKKILVNLGIVILFLFGLKQVVPTLKLDGYSGLFLSILLFTDDTKYSDNYSGWKFLKIKKGMTKNQAYDILGKPILVFSPSEDIISLQYSKSPKDTHYRIRQVYLKDNKVIEKVSYFYVD